MHFKKISDDITKPHEVSLICDLPPWFAGIRYWLNYALSEKDKYHNNPNMRFAFERPIISKRDYNELMKIALAEGLIDAHIEQPFEGYPARTTDQAQTYGERRKEEEQLKQTFGEDVAKWFDELERIASALEPKIRKNKSEFAKNLELLAEVYELSPIECEILGLLRIDSVGLRAAERADGDSEHEYAQEIMAFLGCNSSSKQYIKMSDNGCEDDHDLIKKIFFHSSDLMDSQIVRNYDSYLEYDFRVDDDIIDLLFYRNLTKEIILAKSIGVLVEPELDFEQDCDYLDFRDEMVDSMLGMLGRQTTQGKVYFLAGPPGAGKSVLPATVAAHIEGILRKDEPEFKLPVYVIGIEEDDSGKSSRSRKHKKEVFFSEEDKNEQNNARDKDIRKLLRARRMLRRMKGQAILVVEEADGILSTLVSDQGSAMTRALRSQVLDHSPVITILISNHPEKFDASANRRVVRYTMAAPPSDKRKKMILSMGKKFGMDVSNGDAVAIAKNYVFTPGIIKSALQYLADIVAGQNKRGVKRDGKATFDELRLAFDRKAVTMAGTSIKLFRNLVAPEKIDASLYNTDELSLADLERLANGATSPKLWLFSGHPKTEIADLALYAAASKGDYGVIQIGSAQSETILEQLEAAKREHLPIVITGFNLFLDYFTIDDLRRHPLLIAAQDHVDNGHPVFLIADHTPYEISDEIRGLFGGARKCFVGFNLVAGYDLMAMVGKITGLELPYSVQAFFDSASNAMTNRPNLDTLATNVMGMRGVLVAGPNDVREAYQTLQEEGIDLNFGNLFSIMQRQGVLCTVDREQIQSLTGLRPQGVSYDKYLIN